MREPSRRELFLQNRLALSSSLLYECTQLISGKANPDLKTLIIECELFFSETRTLLLAEIAEEEAQAELPTSAPPAGKSGAVYQSDSWTGWQQASSASPADSGSENPPESTPPQDHSSNPSLGGTPETPNPSQDSLISRIRASWNMRHGSTSTGFSDPNLENL